MTGLTNPKFDYDAIDKQEAAKLRYYEGQLEKSRKKVAAEVIEHGNILRGAQEVLANHHDGVFGAWLDSIGLSRKAAYRAIAASNAFGGCDNCHNLEVSAMYELASNEDAKKKALKLADKGVKVTNAMAKKLLEEAAEKDEPKPPKGKPAEPLVSVMDENDARHRQAIGRQHRTPLESEQPHVAALDGETIDISPQPPTDKCPVCAAVSWTPDGDGWACAKCHHPYGEPAGEPDAKRINEARSLAIKYAEALMRAIDGFNHLLPNLAKHEEALSAAQQSWKTLKAWT